MARAAWAATIVCCAVGASSLFALDASTQPPPAVVDRPLTPATNDRPDEAPSPQHVWVPGHWRWMEGSYVWVAGDWHLPPVPGAAWIAPQWQPQGSGYVLRDGYWQQSGAQGASGQPGEIATTQPPPPPRAEPISERPTPAHVWLPGYWDWSANQFRWVEGRWDVPPRADLTWIPPRWESRGDRYVLVAGYWRDPVITAAPPPPPAPTVVVTQPSPPPAAPVVIVAPPPARQEVVYARPSPQHVWVPGYWMWRGGRHVWVGGHWERPPRGHVHWEEPRWERRGGTYVFIEGHWR